MSASAKKLMAASGARAAAPGQDVFAASGTSSLTNTWIVPNGVTSISVFAVTGGRGGAIGRGGDGGGSIYRNNISVTPGEQLNIFCGNGGVGVSTLSTSRRSVGSNQESYVQRDSDSSYLCRIRLSFGASSGSVGTSPGPGGVGGRGVIFSNNINAFSGGGGGARGYGSLTNDAANGGIGDSTSSVNPRNGAVGSGAGGRQGSRVGGTAMSTGVGGGGGGVGLKGEGASGVTSFGGGGGGSGGEDGGTRTNSGGGDGGEYGGGGGGGAQSDGTGVLRTVPGGVGGPGALRIIWPGDERQYPSTRTADE